MHIKHPAGRLFATCTLTAISLHLHSQLPADSADIYYQHLQLNEVEVTTSVGTAKRKAAASPVTIVTTRMLRQASSSNIIDALSRQPGVAAVTTGSGIAKPIVRGLGYNRVLTVVDGLRQEGQQWGDEHGIEVDAASVERAEILKGPASLIYGSDAMAGVIVLHPEGILPEGEVEGAAQAEHQTNSGLAAYSLRITGNNSGFVYRGRYSEKFAHAYKAPRDGYVPGSQVHERAAQAMLGLNRSWGYTHLNLSGYGLTPGLIEGERDGVTGQLIATAPLKSYSHHLPYQQVDHYKAVSDNAVKLGSGLLKATVGYQLNNRQEFEQEEGDEDEGAGHDGEASLYFRLHTLTADAHYATPISESLRLTAGVAGMAQRSSNMGHEYLLPAYSLHDAGIYAIAAYEKPRWDVSGGLRYDSRWLHSRGLIDDGYARFTDFRRHYSALTASAGAVYHANARFNIRANIARGYRAPNISELASNGIHEGTLRYEIGNSRLHPEHSLQADLGLDYSNRYLSAEVSLFANRVDNYIFSAAEEPIELTGGAAVALSHRNYRFAYTQADALLYGGEASVDIHPVHQLHVASTASVVRSHFIHPHDGIRHLPLTPAPRFTLEAKWELLHNGDHHSSLPHHVGESATHHAIDHIFDNAYVSISLDHNCRQNSIYNDGFTETPTPAYTLLGASVGTDILNHRGHKLLEAYIIADNLLNVAYQNHLSRLKYTDTNIVTSHQGIYAPGRNLTVKVIIPITIKRS